MTAFLTLYTVLYSQNMSNIRLTVTNRGIAMHIGADWMDGCKRFVANGTATYDSAAGVYQPS